MRCLSAEELNRPHRGELLLQTFVVLDRCCEPDAVVPWEIRSVAQYQDDLLFYVDRETAKHRPGRERYARERVEHKLEWHGLACLDCKDSLVRRMPGWITAPFRHVELCPALNRKRVLFHKEYRKRDPVGGRLWRVFS